MRLAVRCYQTADKVFIVGGYLYVVCVCVAAVGLVRFELSAVRRCVAGVFRRVVLGGATGFVLARNSKRNMFEL